MRHICTTAVAAPTLKQSRTSLQASAVAGSTPGYLPHRKGSGSAVLAERVEVDPKTVERWISSGRTPYKAHRWKVAQVLGVDLAHLWPEAENGVPAQRASIAELVALYPNRGFVPAPMWTDIVASAKESVDLLVYAGLFWFDAHPDLSRALVERAEAGVQVRLGVTA